MQYVGSLSSNRCKSRYYSTILQRFLDYTEYFCKILLNRDQDIGKPIGVADYQLIIPKDELQKVINDEIESYENDKRLEQESD